MTKVTVQLRNHIGFFMALAIFIAAIGDALVQTDSDHPYKVSARARALSVAAEHLQDEYGKPVTYEDPILLWRGDTEPIQYQSGIAGTIPARQSFTLPIEARPDKTPVLDVGLVGRVIDAYVSQTDGPRFEVSASQWGLHIIPVKVRDAHGEFVKTATLLDTVISVPEAKRSPSGHFSAICEAVTASTSTGIALKYGGQWMDQYFSSTALPRILSKELKEQVSFFWGVENMIAREAAVALLEHSATTLSWQVLCQTDEGYCVFTPLPITIKVSDPNGTVRGRTLIRDRKK